MLVQIIYVSPSRNNTHLASTRQYKDPGRVQRLYPQLFTVYSTPPANTRTPVKYSDSIHNCSLSTPHGLYLLVLLELELDSNSTSTLSHLFL